MVHIYISFLSFFACQLRQSDTKTTTVNNNNSLTLEKTLETLIQLRQIHMIAGPNFASNAMTFWRHRPLNKGTSVKTRVKRLVKRNALRTERDGQGCTQGRTRVGRIKTDRDNRYTIQPFGDDGRLSVPRSPNGVVVRIIFIPVNSAPLIPQ